MFVRVQLTTAGKTKRFDKSFKTVYQKQFLIFHMNINISITFLMTVFCHFIHPENQTFDNKLKYKCLVSLLQTQMEEIRETDWNSAGGQSSGNTIIYLQVNLFKYFLALTF